MTAGLVVDASGDAEIAPAGRSGDGSLDGRASAPATATFRVGGAAATPAGKVGLHEALRNAAVSGEYDLPRLEGSIHRTNLPGVWHAVRRTRPADMGSLL